MRARSSVGLEHTLDKRGVVGSSPSVPTVRGCSSSGRARALQARGSRFDPDHLHFSITKRSRSLHKYIRMGNK